MNWFKTATIKYSQSSSSSGILISLIRGTTDEMTALHTLSQINDPETCNNISALVNDAQVQNQFPDALSALNSLAAEFKCGTNNPNNPNNNGIMSNTDNNVQQVNPVQDQPVETME